MKRINYIFILLVLTLASCGDKQQSDFDILSYKDRPIGYSDIIDTLSYRFIPLETTDASIIGEIGKVEIVDDKVFVLDNFSKNIYRFDLEGKFIGQIGGRGQGPGEFVDPCSFVINHKDRQIVICDRASFQILFYDYDGNFIHSCRMRANQFAYLPESKDIVFLCSPAETDEQYELRRFRYCTNEPVGGYIPRPNFVEKQAYRTVNNYFVQQGDSYYFISLFTDELYCLTEEGVTLVHKFGFEKDIFDYDRAAQTTDVYKAEKLDTASKFYINNEGSYMFKMGYGMETEFDIIGNIHSEKMRAGGQIYETVSRLVSCALNTVGVHNEYFISAFSYGHRYPDKFPERTEDDNPILVLYKVKFE